MADLGDKVKDVITGFTGIVIAKTKYINGCSRCGVQSTELGKDGLPTESIGFDDPQLRIIAKKKVKETSKDTGGVGDQVNQKRTLY